MAAAANSWTDIEKEYYQYAKDGAIHKIHDFISKNKVPMNWNNDYTFLRACEMGYGNVVRFFLDEGYNPYFNNGEILDVLKKSGQEEIRILITERCGEMIAKDILNEAHILAENGDLEKFIKVFRFLPGVRYHYTDFAKIALKAITKENRARQVEFAQYCMQRAEKYDFEFLLLALRNDLLPFVEFIIGKDADAYGQLIKLKPRPLTNEQVNSLAAEILRIRSVPLLTAFQVRLYAGQELLSDFALLNEIINQSDWEEGKTELTQAFVREEARRNEPDSDSDCPPTNEFNGLSNDDW